MKVEQLKAELVVFKGLMSNVSAAAAPRNLPEQAGPSSLGRLTSWSLPPPGVPCLSLCLPPTPPSFKRERRNRSPSVMSERQCGLPHF